MATLAAEIRAALGETGVSQYRFAVSAGLNPQTVSRYLAGRTWSATTEDKLARALDRLLKTPASGTPPHHRRKTWRGVKR
jgi:hypothetical protein